MKRATSRVVKLNRHSQTVRQVPDGDLREYDVNNGNRMMSRSAERVALGNMMSADRRKATLVALGL